MTVLYDRRNGFMKRICPICENELSYGEFAETNFTLEMRKRHSIWLNDKITILCCHCLNLIVYIDTYPEYDIIPVDSKDCRSWCIKQKDKIILGVKVNFKVYENMKEMGLIDND